MNNARIADVVQVVTGKLTTAEVAQRHGVSVVEVETWRALYLGGLDGSAAGVRALRRRRWPLALAGLLLVGSLGSRVSMASGSACGETLPGTLTPFCPDQPARSSVINENYRALITLIDTKVGQLTGPGLTVTGTATVSGDASVTGAVSAVRATFNSTALPASTATAIANDSSSTSLVIAGRGAAPTRKVLVRDDLTVAGNLNVVGTLSGGQVAGTVTGGGELSCVLGSVLNVVTSCAPFGGATCPALSSACSPSTRVGCPAGSTLRDLHRDCTSSVSYACIHASLCIRD